jgi:competence protein ComEC
VAQVVAALPLAQWPLGRPAPWLALLLSLGLLGWLLPGLRRRWRQLAGLALVVALAAQVLLQRADHLLLVHQGRRDLLLARHRGRASLVALQADSFSCRRSQQLATALGIHRYDWILLLDPLPPLDPACWKRLSALVVAAADGAPPLQPGQRLVAGRLQAEPLGIASRGLRLQLGNWRWLLLPDPQDLWAWRQQQASQPKKLAPQGIWLGFAPAAADRVWLRRQPGVLWFSGEPRRSWPAHWRASGASGSLEARAGPIAL